MEKAVIFTINGKTYQVSDLPANTTLNTFIRDQAHLRGTKFMCQEGGCGACIVSVKTENVSSGKSKTLAVNSCLVPIYSCHGWSIKTVEALGNRFDGYGNVQARLAVNHGTQCGYCSPGMVMNMHSLLQNGKDLSMEEIENSFGGNICRCTGYRPILDAFKSFATDAPRELIQKCVDIEELTNICPKNGKVCNSICDHSCEKNEKISSGNPLKLNISDGKNWYRVNSVSAVLKIFNSIGDHCYSLVAGNTAYGVYRPAFRPLHFIDISNIQELHLLEVSGNNITLGANVSLSDAMSFFYDIAKSDMSSRYPYAKQFGDHIDLIANVPVRNTGTLAGNLSIKNQHREFPSDIFVIFEAVGAHLNIVDKVGKVTCITAQEYLSVDMRKKIITKIILPAYNASSYVFTSYKITPRSQNAHAYVNAGFLFKLDKDNNYKVLEKPRIIFGGINPHFIHAKETESYLNGKKLLDTQVVQKALNTLSDELQPDYVLPDASPEYRKGLAISLLYKFILSVFPEKLSAKIKSGGEILKRPLSTGKQDFETEEGSWPLNKPVPKIEAYTQCSGEAEYVNDIPSIQGELYGAVVTAKQATATSFELDPTEALAIPGVFAFYSAKDIPGENDFMNPAIAPVGFQLHSEEVFASKNILFAGQALGVVLAETQALAEEAAEKVKVQYNGVTKPITDILQVIASGDSKRIIQNLILTPSEETKIIKGDAKHNISGKFLLHGQYHYHMETQTCYCVPVEDGLDVYPSSQWPRSVQSTIANVLNVDQSSINVSVRRLGGAYGAKIDRNNQISAICGLSAHLSKRPVRVILSLETNMQMVGKRFPTYFDYKVGTDDDGKIQYLESKVYHDVGAVPVGSLVPFVTSEHMKNTYNSDNWTVLHYLVLTDTPTNTWVRAPGSTEAVAMIEHMIEHIANVVKRDPISVRLINLKEECKPLVKMIDDIKVSSDYVERVKEVESFNTHNRWKKRGITLVPINYPVNFWGKYNVNISIFSSDGTVAISHGGTECGQGINTKVAQVCAYILGIPLEYVKIKPTMTLISPNNSPTGGSITSESVAYGVKCACEELNERLKPIKDEMPGAKWKDIIKKADNSDINLNINLMYTKSEELENYNVFAVTVLEAEVDILTGQNQIVRTDIVEDAGQSLSPQIDIGQVEGAFVMGLGYFLTEQLTYDEETGKLLTDRTWNYKPPGVKDIPIDFRVTLLRNARNPVGVLRSKATGEPPLNLSCAALFALRNALESARKDSGKTEDWFYFGTPLSCEKIWLNGLTKIEDMTL